MVVSSVIVIVLSVRNPIFLVENQFLKNFINHELLNILAVIATVTAASAANIHFAFNRLEETIGKPGDFKDARKEIYYGVYLLIGLLLAAIVILIIRSFAIDNIYIVSLLNGTGLIFLLINILVLIDVTSTVFSIPSHPS